MFQRFETRVGGGIGNKQGHKSAALLDDFAEVEKLREHAPTRRAFRLVKGALLEVFEAGINVRWKIGVLPIERAVYDVTLRFSPLDIRGGLPLLSQRSHEGDEGIAIMDLIEKPFGRGGIDDVAPYSIAVRSNLLALGFHISLFVLIPTDPNP